MEGWKDGRVEDWISLVLSECTSHLGEYSANRGEHREHRGRGKKRGLAKIYKHIAPMGLGCVSFAFAMQRF